MPKRKESQVSEKDASDAAIRFLIEHQAGEHKTLRFGCISCLCQKITFDNRNTQRSVGLKRELHHVERVLKVWRERCMDSEILERLEK